jgi:hypothetical protein
MDRIEGVKYGNLVKHIFNVKPNMELASLCHSPIKKINHSECCG